MYEGTIGVAICKRYYNPLFGSANKILSNLKEIHDYSFIDKMMKVKYPISKSSCIGPFHKTANKQKLFKETNSRKS